MGDILLGFAVGATSVAVGVSIGLHYRSRQVRRYADAWHRIDPTILPGSKR